jgi:hypothetical protein
VIAGGGYRDAEKWNVIHDRMIDAMKRLEHSLAPYVQMLESEHTR